MTDLDVQATGWSDPEEHEMAEYRPVCGLAVASLVVSFLSPLAFFHPVLWFVPLVAALLAAVSLWRIARAESGLVGGKWAAIALSLALFCLAAAPVRTLVFYHMIDREARCFAMQWFEQLRENQPHRAHQFTAAPENRLPLDEGLWDSYLSNEMSRKNLDSFVNRPVVRQLLALGRKALVRYYDTESFWHEKGLDWVKQIFAITYEDQGEKKTFFVAVYLARHVIGASGNAEWEISNVVGGVRPAAYRGPAQVLPGAKGGPGT